MIQPPFVPRTFSAEDLDSNRRGVISDGQSKAVDDLLRWRLISAFISLAVTGLLLVMIMRIRIRNTAELLPLALAAVFLGRLFFVSLLRYGSWFVNQTVIAAKKYGVKRIDGQVELFDGRSYTVMIGTTSFRVPRVVWNKMPAGEMVAVYYAVVDDWNALLSWERV